MKIDPFHGFNSLAFLLLLFHYRYGGVYLDSDIIVLNKLYSLNNTVGMDKGMDGNTMNGAVMAFRKHRYFRYAYSYAGFWLPVSRFSCVCMFEKSTQLFLPWLQILSVNINILFFLFNEKLKFIFFGAYCL